MKNVYGEIIHCWIIILYYGCVVTTDGCCYMSASPPYRTHSKTMFRCAHEFLYGLQWGQLCSFYICYSRLSTFDSNHWQCVYAPFCVIDTECDPLMFNRDFFFKCRTWIACLFLVVNDTEMKIVINWINCYESSLPPPFLALISRSKPMKNFIRHLFWANKCIICRCISKNSHTSPFVRNILIRMFRLTSIMRRQFEWTVIVNTFETRAMKNRASDCIHASMVPSLTFDKSVNDTQSSLFFK